MSKKLDVILSGETDKILIDWKIEDYLLHSGSVIKLKPIDLPLTDRVTYHAELGENYCNGETENLAGKVSNKKMIVSEFLSNNGDTDKIVWYKSLVFLPDTAFNISIESSDETHNDLELSQDLEDIDEEPFNKAVVPANETVRVSQKFKPQGSVFFKDNKDLELSIMIAEGRKKQEFDQHDISENEVAKLPTSVYHDSSFKDIKILVDGTTLMAHKLVLVAQSKVFHSMLTLDTKEKQEGVIEIKDVDSCTFEKFLRFLYTGDIGDIKDCVVDLISIADKYDVQLLKKRCENYMIQNVDEDNVIHYLIKADTLNCHLLKRRALDFIKEHMRHKKNALQDFPLLYNHPQLMGAIYMSHYQEYQGRSDDEPLSKKKKLEEGNYNSKC